MHPPYTRGYNQPSTEFSGGEASYPKNICDTMNPALSTLPQPPASSYFPSAPLSTSSHGYHMQQQQQLSPNYPSSVDTMQRGTPYQQQQQTNTAPVPSTTTQPYYQQPSSGTSSSGYPYGPISTPYQGDLNDTRSTSGTTSRQQLQQTTGFSKMASPSAPVVPLGMSQQRSATTLITDEMLEEMCAGHEYVRPTCSRMPNSMSLQQKSLLPLGFIFRPLAPSEQMLPHINFGPTSPIIRCLSCRSYINPFAAWDMNGRRWTCNFCGLLNECPSNYVCPVDETRRRTDRYERKELSCGSVEIHAPAEYMVRPPQPPTYVFLIDVSATSVTSGLLAVVCQGIKSAINTGKVPGGTRTQISIITFDSSIHFYKLDNTTVPNTPPQMVVVSSLDDVFVPLPEGIVVNLGECESVIKTLLTNLPSMWSKQRIVEACGGSALKAASLVIKQWGGKISLFMSTTPTLGELSLAPLKSGGRSSDTTRGGSGSTNETEAIFLRPLNNNYKDFATTMVQSQISVDLYLCPVASASSQNTPQSIDVPTLSPISKYTAGEVRYYPCFHAMTCGHKLREEIVHSLTRETGWETVMRIRVSRGWKITNWYGNFYLRHNDLLVVPNAHRDQAFAITIELDGNTTRDPYVYAQSALLYTNSEGERRIRLHTYCVPIVQHLGDVINSIDEVATMGVLTHQALDQAQKTNLADARHFLQNACTQIYSSIQQNAAGGLIASSALVSSLLPHYTLGILKSIAFREPRVFPDMRCASWMRLSTLPLNDMSGIFLPRLFPLHDMPEDAGTLDASRNIILPPLLALSNVHLSQAGAYLVEDGESMILWVGRVVDPQWLNDVFGVDNIDHIHPEHADSTIGATGSQLGLRMAAIINAIRASRLPFMKLFVIRQGAALESRFFSMMIEDRSQALPVSYSDFMQKIGGTRNTVGVVGTATTSAQGFQRVYQGSSGPGVTSTGQIPPTASRKFSTGSASIHQTPVPYDPSGAVPSSYEGSVSTTAPMYPHPQYSSDLQLQSKGQPLPNYPSTNAYSYTSPIPPASMMHQQPPASMMHQQPPASMMHQQPQAPGYPYR